MPVRLRSAEQKNPVYMFLVFFRNFHSGITEDGQIIINIHPNVPEPESAAKSVVGDDAEKKGRGGDGFLEF